MSLDRQEDFQLNYQAGISAFEKGEYSLSIQYLEAASKLIDLSSRLGGEVQMWLVTVYQAKGMNQDAIALCEQLSAHPHYQIKKQSQEVLYIIKAPQLTRPKEWLTEIPDLANLEASELEYKKPINSPKSNRNHENKYQDIQQINTQDNHFIIIALFLIFILLFFYKF